MSCSEATPQSDRTLRPVCVYNSHHELDPNFQSYGIQFSTIPISQGETLSVCLHHWIKYCPRCLCRCAVFDVGCVVYEYGVFEMIKCTLYVTLNKWWEACERLCLSERVWYHLQVAWNSTICCLAPTAPVACKRFPSAQLDHSRRVHAQMLWTFSERLEICMVKYTVGRDSRDINSVEWKMFENESTASRCWRLHEIIQSLLLRSASKRWKLVFSSCSSGKFNSEWRMTVFMVNNLRPSTHISLSPTTIH